MLDILKRPPYSAVEYEGHKKTRFETRVALRIDKELMSTEHIEAISDAMFKTRYFFCELMQQIFGTDNCLHDYHEPDICEMQTPDPSGLGTVCVLGDNMVVKQ